MGDIGNARTVSIAAKPYAYEFGIPTTALMVIDMQNDFCAPRGFGELLGNDITPARSIVPVVRELLQACRETGMLVVHTREGHEPNLADCPPSKLERSRRQGAGIGDIGPMGRILIRGEYGHGIVEELAPAAGEWIIDKPGKGAFYRTGLEERLRLAGIRSLLLAGVTTHVCVHTTMREANDRGFECLLLEDATASFDSADHEAALRMAAQQGGIFGWVGLMADVKEALTFTS